jgi:hypothetical protein
MASTICSQLYLSPQPEAFFPVVTSHSPFKAFVCATLHPFHNLKMVWQVMENLTAASLKVPLESLPFARHSKAYAYGLQN